MDPILNYLLKVSLLLGMSFGVYYFFLRKETFVVHNRYFFWVTTLCAISFPFLYFTKTVEVVAATEGMNPSSDHPAVAALSWQAYTVWVCLSVAVFLLLRLGVSLFYLVYKISKLEVIEFNGEQICLDPGTSRAYSFWKWVVLPMHFEKKGTLEWILLHEKVHIRQKHTLDLLFFEIIKAVFWFNPVVWWLKKQVNLNLEYIVDQEVCEEANRFEYQMSLVRYGQDNYPVQELVNSFQSSDLRKRIAMLNTQKSNYMKRFKAILLMPIWVGYFIFFQVKTEAKTLLIQQGSEELYKEQEWRAPTDIVAFATSQEKLKEEHKQKLLTQKRQLKAEREKLRETASQMQAEKDEFTEIKEKYREEQEKHLSIQKQQLKVAHDKLRETVSQMRSERAELAKAMGKFKEEREKHLLTQKEKLKEERNKLYDMVSQIREDAEELRTTREKLKGEREILLIHKKESRERRQREQKRRLKEKQTFSNKQETIHTATLGRNGQIVLDGNVVDANSLATLSPDKIRTISIYKGSDSVKEGKDEMTIKEGVVEIYLQ